MDDGIFYKDAVEKPFPMEVGSMYQDVMVGGPGSSSTSLSTPAPQPNQLPELRAKKMYATTALTEPPVRLPKMA